MTKLDIQKAGLYGFGANLPLSLLSAPPAFYPSEAGEINAVRSADILGIPDFFNHAGNCIDGSMPAWAITMAGVAIADRIPEEKQPVFVAGISTLAAAGAIGLNVAYEAGVEIPPVPQKPEDAPFDGPDALFGSVSGTIVAATFCYAALRNIRKSRSKNTANLAAAETVSAQA